MVPAEDGRGLLTGPAIAGTQTRILATAAVDKKTLLTVGRDGDTLDGFEISGVEFNVDRSAPTA